MTFVSANLMYPFQCIIPCGLSRRNGCCDYYSSISLAQPRSSYKIRLALYWPSVFPVIVSVRDRFPRSLASLVLAEFHFCESHVHICRSTLMIPVNAAITAPDIVIPVQMTVVASIEPPSSFIWFGAITAVTVVILISCWELLVVLSFTGWIAWICESIGRVSGISAQAQSVMVRWRPDSERTENDTQRKQ